MKKSIVSCMIMSILSSVTSYCEGSRMQWSEFSFVLKPSPIKGVGVFAAHDITAGTDLLVPEGQVIRKLNIKDVPQEFITYCVYINDDEVCIAPERFDCMEIGWYINTSPTPNVAERTEPVIDSATNVVKPGLYAIRDIKAGEEIVMEYQELKKSHDSENFSAPWSEYSFVLKPSTSPGVGGVGLFATHDIPAGTELFRPEGHVFRKFKIKDVPSEFLKYCVYINSDECIGPKRFDRMEIGWYINHSATPNISALKEPEIDFITNIVKPHFSAIKDIKVGEEIVMDYNELDEPDEHKEDFYRLSDYLIMSR